MERDEVELTQEYTDAMKIIKPQLDALNKRIEAQGNGLGSCHILWSNKKEMLAQQGVDWKTPHEMNPHVMFD